jgi:protein phosphatase
MRVVLRISASPALAGYFKALNQITQGALMTRRHTTPDVTGHWLSDVGCVRKINEDRGLFYKPESSDTIAAKGVLGLLADGMGGHAAGEVASSMAADIVQRYYFESDKEPQAALVEAFRIANREIYARARSEKRFRGMGTTCTAIVIIGSRAICAHVGDSRLYLIRKRDITRLTEDHSEVMKLLKDGVITAKEAARYPKKNILLRALGVEPEAPVDIWPEPLVVRADDRFLLCSDGLSDLVKDNEIKKLCARGSLQEVCQALVSLAKARGAPDNVTVVILENRTLAVRMSH